MPEMYRNAVTSKAVANNASRAPRPYKSARLEVLGRVPTSLVMRI